LSRHEGALLRISSPDLDLIREADRCSAWISLDRKSGACHACAAIHDFAVQQIMMGSGPGFDLLRFPLANRYHFARKRSEALVIP
jgi:hypothetical protein